MAKLVILTLELLEARALLAKLEPNLNKKAPNENQYHGVTQVAINKLDKAVQRASLNQKKQG